MNLAALQQQFCDRLLDDAAPDDAAGFGIYRNAYRARLMETLRTGFEKTWSWIGDDAFEAAARQHIILNPPSSWTLDDYGGDFDVTLAALFPDDLEVAELAWLERTMQRAFAALDEPPVTAEAAQAHVESGGDWDRMRIGFVASLGVQPICTNAHAIWQAIADEEAPPAAASVQAGKALRVWRKGLTPCFRAIEPTEFRAIGTLRAGANFGELCAELARELGDEAAVAQAGAMLGTWLGDELIATLD